MCLECLDLLALPNNVLSCKLRACPLTEKVCYLMRKSASKVQAFFLFFSQEERRKKKAVGLNTAAESPVSPFNVISTIRSLGSRWRVQPMDAGSCR